ncbi:MAG TPA: protein-methionine-sulfoxide reductase heme-binding subunit MsrQ [Burkholderiaceae bacterium]|nr:protein-methionine-sulfoxide reductase heme-binding subunit MsrQ [Burkholderiaceae bacterium]
MAGLSRAFRFVPPALPASVFAAVRAVVFTLAMLPLLALIYRATDGGLGANPVEAILRSLGTWTLVLLLVTLAITPLRWLTGWAWLLRLRRMLGLTSFFYALLHVVAFVWLDHWFEWAAIVADVVKRPYLTFGFAAFVLMIPLAATSTNAMVRRLGGRQWQQLHRLVYGIAVLGVLHFWFHKLAKNDLAEPALYAAVLAVLLGTRLIHWWVASRRPGGLVPAVRR